MDWPLDVALVAPSMSSLSSTLKLSRLGASSRIQRKARPTKPVHFCVGRAMGSGSEILI